ncbi:MAG: neutral/alkaline non-lysosomal ceramidase N-terminal domain-containing protein, partial [Verrucomicrobia bacterium]|nr:neutral/alkaline non-lysosomal ceramidase N-terminal domain-containing protein [Verrucomicrobiota bacterium]
MKIVIRYVLFLCMLPVMVISAITAGVGKADITPPIGTPSAGYTDRKGEGMEGIHDPLLAIALFLDNGEKKIVLCSVDHLGFTYDMVKEVTSKVQSHPNLKDTEIYIASSHTHSGGGAYLNIPVLGENLAGTYNFNTTQLYIEKTVDAIFQAYENKVPAKVGIGYGKVEGLSKYRGLYPKDITPVSDITVIKVTHLDDRPYAVLFN